MEAIEMEQICEGSQDGNDCTVKLEFLQRSILAKI